MTRERERDIEIVVKEIDGDRDRRAQSATNLLLPVQPLPRDLILSQSNICLTAPPLYLCETLLFFYILYDFVNKDKCMEKEGLHTFFGKGIGYFVIFSRLNFQKHEKYIQLPCTPTQHPLSPPLSREYFHKLNRGGKLPQQSVN